MHMHMYIYMCMYVYIYIYSSPSVARILPNSFERCLPLSKDLELMVIALEKLLCVYLMIVTAFR